MSLVSKVCFVLVAVVFLFGAMAQADSLIIETENGQIEFSIELADTLEARRTGLMFRDRLPSRSGMLFDYRHPQRVSMWMKNTLIPLDMLFITSDGVIEKIADRTVPHSLNAISSGRPVRGVLELNGGTAEHLGIEEGDLVRHRIFGNAEWKE